MRLELTLGRVENNFYAIRIKKENKEKSANRA